MTTAVIRFIWRVVPAPLRDRFWRMLDVLHDLPWKTLEALPPLPRLLVEVILNDETIAERKPVNFDRRDPATIARDVDLALHYAGQIRAMIADLGLDPSNSSLLEIGPGINFGAELLLAQDGAKVAVADRFLAPWDSTYHPTFYRSLRDRAGGDPRPFDAVLAANSYPPEVIGLYAAPAETLAGIADASLDLVLSNAVLEHVYDLKAVCRSLARVTKAGGINSHQVDFRDHGHFDRPLEFLLQGRLEGRIKFAHDRGQLGNRKRPSELVRLLRSAGFATVDVAVDKTADEAYLRDFIPRLRRSRSQYRNWPEEDLRILGARITARR